MGEASIEVLSLSLSFSSLLFYYSLFCMEMGRSDWELFCLFALFALFALFLL